MKRLHIRISLCLLFVLLTHNTSAQEQLKHFLKLSMHDGTEMGFPLKERPNIIFINDSIKISSGKQFAKAKRSEVRKIFFASGEEHNYINGEIIPNRYYRIKGVSGNYLDASIISDNTDSQYSELSMRDTSEGLQSGTIFYYHNKQLLNYNTGTYIDDNGTVSDIESIAGTWEIVVSPQYSNRFIIKNPNGLMLSDEDGCKVGLSETINGTTLFMIEQVTQLPINITSAGYATWYAPVHVELPEKIKAHTIAIRNSFAILSEGHNIVPAYTGVLLSGAEGIYNLNIAETVTDKYDSILKGTIAATLIYEQAYVLSNTNANVGFYKAKLNQKDNTAFINNSHKAYLLESSLEKESQNSTGFRIGHSDTTNIESTKNDNIDTIYDIHGRRIKSITEPGVYIINRQKVYVTNKFIYLYK